MHDDFDDNDDDDMILKFIKVILKMTMIIVTYRTGLSVNRL